MIGGSILTISGVESKTIYVNESGWWITSFNNSSTPLNDALKFSSPGDVVIVYSNGSIVGVIPIENILATNWLPVFGLIVLAVSISFVFTLALGYRASGRLDTGEMRRAIAGAILIGIHCLLFLSITFNIARDVVVGAYVGGLSSVIGYYFGSRSAQQVEREEGFLKVENVEFRCNDKRQIVISLRNGTKRSVVVDAVYVNGKSQKINRVAIEPKSVKDVVLDFDWSENEVYNIKVCTSEGICLKEVSKA